MLGEGTIAPLFSLPDQTGAVRSLAEFRGGWLLLYFYPADDTPGCTAEACGFRDARSEFKAAGIRVVGVSPDSVKSHQKFAEKYQLPFTILSDEQKRVIQLYEAYGQKLLFGKRITGIKRVSYLIDPEGVIRKLYPRVDPRQHSELILADFRGLQV